jgi:membrane glycosyltransferase
MELLINPWSILVAAVAALVVGFVWYNPKVFGNAWMKASGMTEEKMKGGNMAVIFGLALLFAAMMASVLMHLCNHQFGAYSLIGGDEAAALPSYQAFMDDYGTAFRTFKHGAFHGALAGVFFALPLIGTNALFERKGAKYIFVNSGYWIVTLTLMGAIICGM